MKPQRVGADFAAGGDGAPKSGVAHSEDKPNEYNALDGMKLAVFFVMKCPESEKVHKNSAFTCL